MLTYGYGNVNDHRKGANVRALATRHRRIGPDFPGWGAPDYADHLLAIPEGLTGTVTYVESHGSNPWTRYTVEFDDGTRASGLVDGKDIAFTS